jgi:hypothetical protein
MPSKTLLSGVFKRLFCIFDSCAFQLLFMKNSIYILLVLCTLASCQKSNSISKIVGMDWLLGKWQNKSDAGNLLETWKKVNDSVFIGESYFIKEKDTLHFEQIQLKKKGQNLLYVSTIKGQNNNKPITFIHNPEIEKQLVFENLKNEYPRKIVYKPFATNHLLIEISGIQQEKVSSTRYSMRKTQ